MNKNFDALFLRIDTIFQAKKLPKLKTLFRGTINNVSNLVNLMVRKSLLKENLYNYADTDESKFFLPEEKTFMDNEKASVIYDRLKAFIDAIDFQAANLLDDFDSISKKYIDNCIKLLHYFAFNNYTSQSSGVNTRTLREMTDRIMASKDQILRRIVQDNLKLLSDNFNRSQNLLDEILKYKKDKYKALIKFHVFPFLPEVFTEKLLMENPTEYLKKLEKFIASNSPNISFNKGWMIEAIKLCYSTTEDSYLEYLKKEYLSNESKPKPKVNIHSPREKLLLMIREIAATADILEDSYFRLDQNIKFIHDRKRNFLEQFVEILKKALNTQQDQYFHIEYIDPISKKIKNDSVNIHDFFLTIKKKIALFKEIMKPNSSVYNKINSGTEEALYKFMEDTYFDLLLTKERINGISGEIRLKVPRKDRTQLKEMIGVMEKFEDAMKKVGDKRRKYVIEQDVTSFKK